MRRMVSLQSSLAVSCWMDHLVFVWLASELDTGKLNRATIERKPALFTTIAWPTGAPKQDGIGAREGGGLVEPSGSARVWLAPMELPLQEAGQGTNMGLAQDVKVVSSHVVLDNLVSSPGPAKIGANLHPRGNQFVLVGAHDEQTAVQVFPLGGKVLDQHVAGRPIQLQSPPVRTGPRSRLKRHRWWYTFPCFPVILPLLQGAGWTRSPGKARDPDPLVPPMAPRRSPMDRVGISPLSVRFRPLRRPGTLGKYY